MSKTTQGSQPAGAALRSGRVRWRPVLSVLVALTWLLLQQSLSLPNVLTALLLGWLVPRIVAGFLGPAAHLRAWGVAVRLLGRVVRDIVVSNVVVARIVLDPTSRPAPLWVCVPLEVEHPNAIALLASIITMTPGTVSCIVDEDRRLIWVHALNADDGPALVADIKERYERPLKEILG